MGTNKAPCWPINQSFFPDKSLKNQSKEAFFGTFWKTMTKISFFFSARALPLKIIIYWRQRRLQKVFSVGRPKMDFLKSNKGGTLWVGRGSNP